MFSGNEFRVIAQVTLGFCFQTVLCLGNEHINNMCSTFERSITA